MEAIVAVFSDWGIGCDGTQQLALKADRKHFREITGSDAVIVGRRTMMDFPGSKPLKGRHNIVITRQKIDIEEAEVVHTTEEAADAAQRQGRCLVIGGASVYRQMMPYINTVHVTKIELQPRSDSFFENLDESPDWILADRSDIMLEDGIAYSFITYKRI